MGSDLIILSYDVTDDKIRNKVSALLKDYGHRIQKSVFALYLNSSDAEHVIKKVSEMIDPKTDRIRVYKICKTCRESIEVYGISDFPEEEEFFIT